MSIKKRKSRDADILGSFAALKRAAKRAHELARQTNTPCYVMIKGKIVDLTKQDTHRVAKKKKSRRSS